jgi:hypothetical protein
MENLGALVGWSHMDAGDNILLRLESFQSISGLAGNEPDMSRLLMTKQQALVLGHYLMRVSGETIRPPRKRWLRALVKRRPTEVGAA